jgi:hypothetical protein
MAFLKIQNNGRVKNGPKEHHGSFPHLDPQSYIFYMHIQHG